MPSRLGRVVILVYWAVAAVGLFSRDILPEFLIGSPPDLRALAAPGASQEPVAWSILTSARNAPQPSASGVAGPAESMRRVGEAATRTVRVPDGGVELTSVAWFNSNELLRGTPFETPQKVRLTAQSAYRIDKAGKLQGFTVEVSSDLDVDGLASIVGTVRKKTLEVKSTGPLPILNWTKSFPYDPKGLVQDTLGPIDRLPGLHVGQRWDTRLISPLTGRVESVRVEVLRLAQTYWEGELVTAFEVASYMTPFRATTWVRPDGLVLRQEVPFPLFRVVLERQSQPSASGLLFKSGGR